MNKSIQDIRETIGRYGIEGGDRYDLPASQGRFPDGCHYRNEISGVGGADALAEVVDEAQTRDVPVHRIILGNVTKMTQDEIRDVASIADENLLEIVMDTGVTSTSTIGRHAETSFGKWGGWRARGADQLSYLVQAVHRGIECGMKAFLLYDEGALWLLSQMREQGDLPSDVIFKVSYTAGYRNPAGARLLESIGADSFNPVTDLELPMLAALRQSVDIPMDIVINGWETLGSFTRMNECPELIRVSAPCYLKQELHGDQRAKVRYCEIIREMVQASRPELTLSGPGPEDLHVPETV
jgi:hypothetical protein